MVSIYLQPKKISKNRSCKKLVRHLLGSVIICKIMLFLIVGIIIVGFSLTSTQYESNKYTIILALAPILANTFLPTWFFQGLEKMRYIMWVAIVSKVITVITLWLFVRDADDTYLVLIIIAVLNAKATIVSYWIIYNMGYYPEFSLKHVRYTASYGFQYFIARVSSASFTSMNGILLGLLVSIQAVGAYTIALQFYTGLHSLFVPLYHATYPYMAREKNPVFILKILLMIVPFIVIVSIISYFMFPYVLEFLVTSAFDDAIDIFNVMLLILLVNIISSFIGYPLFVAIGKNYIANYSLMVGALWHISTLTILAMLGYISAINVALVALSTEILISSIRMRFVFKYIAFKGELMHVLKRRYR